MSVCEQRISPTLVQNAPAMFFVRYSYGDTGAAALFFLQTTILSRDVPREVFL